MNWFVRIASAPECGAGHVMRSGALARALAERISVTVVLDRNGMDWAWTFATDGVTAIAAGDESDLPCAGVVLDGYDFTQGEIDRWRQRARTLVVIDDFLSPPSCADLVIAPAPHLRGKQIDGIPALMGAHYALLGPAFADLPRRSQGHRDIPRIVVGFGAIDSSNATGLSIEALSRTAAGRRIEAVALVGERFTHLPALRALAGRHGEWLRLLVGEKHIAELWRSADLAIGAGGVSMLERMACGCPSICIATADNQRLALSEIETLGVARFGGYLPELNTESLAMIVDEVLADVGGRRLMSERARILVDGHGADRAAESILQRDMSVLDRVS